MERIFALRKIFFKKVFPQFYRFQYNHIRKKSSSHCLLLKWNNQHGTKRNKSVHQLRIWAKIYLGHIDMSNYKSVQIWEFWNWYWRWNHTSIKQWSKFNTYELTVNPPLNSAKSSIEHPTNISIAIPAKLKNQKKFVKFLNFSFFCFQFSNTWINDRSKCNPSGHWSSSWTEFQYYHTRYDDTDTHNQYTTDARN